MSKKRLSPEEKNAAIIKRVHQCEMENQTVSIYKLAIIMGYTPNGTFNKNVWSCVEAGLLEAIPSYRNHRFFWALEITQKAWNERELWL